MMIIIIKFEYVSVENPLKPWLLLPSPPTRIVNHVINNNIPTLRQTSCGCYYMYIYVCALITQSWFFILILSSRHLEFAETVLSIETVQTTLMWHLMFVFMNEMMFLLHIDRNGNLFYDGNFLHHMNGNVYGFVNNSCFACYCFNSCLPM